MQQAEMDTKFGALHRAVLMLDKFGYPLSKTTRELFAIAPQRYRVRSDVGWGWGGGPC